MNDALRQQIIAAAEAASRRHPASLDHALQEGTRRLRRRVALVYAAVIIAIAVLVGAVTALPSVLGARDPIPNPTPSPTQTSSTVTPTPRLTGLTVSPTRVSLLSGGTRQLTASGSYSDGTTRDLTGTVGWTSADVKVATIDATGLLTAASPGSTTVTATADGTQGSTDITVTAPTPTLTGLTVSPTPVVLPAGGTRQLTATGSYSDGTTRDLTGTATWTTTDVKVATIDATGLLTATSPGTTTVTATADGTQASAEITVTARTLTGLTVSPAQVTLDLGDKWKLTAKGSYSDGTTSDLKGTVTWVSDRGEVATVDRTTGWVTGQQEGTATVTATADGLQASSTITVIRKVD
jgi:trimeric autotransporter adhesin